eukprot:CAMPEP_0173377580 /NCGR_PEP_ID=MMETSP1356-20130122/826_1 /TAXON_ID=77927 ORGANISM="Hemiselmis virescens, Strain PCC157" /NCGR_SAMPLE_ID=MMETSP1356 /ASSEMBLY_ACC=CAM_ASM_000847 /LENGTH=411 /DNA_ID=CAMNT_0014330377 /DNA_START=68 /DNA_END=1303 /DNA_ORIENTATION=-
MSHVSFPLLMAAVLLALSAGHSEASVLAARPLEATARASPLMRGDAGGPLLRAPFVLSDAGAKLTKLGDSVQLHARAASSKVGLVAKAASKKVVSAIDLEKYPKLFAAGGICASFTHWVTVPIDVVKTRTQVNPGEFTGVSSGIQSIFKNEGWKGIMRGATPTTIGFLLQGSLKYGFYEFFKDSLSERSRLKAAKEDPIWGSKKPKGLAVPEMIFAASCAEVLGTTALLPFEATRIRMVADPSYGKGMVEVMKKVVGAEGIKGLYNGVLPIMCKQIPFTITQFLMFETVATALYSDLSHRGVDTDKWKTGITLVSGVIAGTSASLLSQPGDTVLSMMNKSPGLSVAKCVKQLGPAGLFRGGGARMIHVSSYVIAQFLIYDSIKRACGIPVAGSQAIKKKEQDKDKKAKKAK